MVQEYLQRIRDILPSSYPVDENDPDPSFTKRTSARPVEPSSPQPIPASSTPHRILKRIRVIPPASREGYRDEPFILEIVKNDLKVLCF